MAAKLVAAFEAKSSSAHSSPTNATREVPTHLTTKKKANDYVLVSLFVDKDGKEAKTETSVDPLLMHYEGERDDDDSSDLKWSYYTYTGNDVRLAGEYFLYAIRGSNFYCRHRSLMNEYRLNWMASGPQRLKRRPTADGHTLEDDDDVVTIRRPGEGRVAANLEATIEALENLSSHDDNSIEPYQYRAEDAENSAQRRQNNDSDEEDEDYFENAQRIPDNRLNSSPGSHRTPEHENHSVQNFENTTGRLDNRADNRRHRYAYHEAPSFREMAPEFAEKSPATRY